MAIPAADFGKLLSNAQDSWLQQDAEDRKRQIVQRRQQKIKEAQQRAAAADRAVQAEKNRGGLATVAKFGPSAAVDVAKTVGNQLVVQPVIDVGKTAKNAGQKAVEQVKYLGQPAATPQQRQAVITNQQTAQNSDAYKKAIEGLDLRGNTASGVLAAQKMAAQGASADEIRQHLASDSQALKQQNINAAETFGTIASFAPSGKGVEALTNALRSKKVVQTALDESRLLPAQAGNGAPVVTDQTRLLEAGKVNTDLAQRVQAADPATVKRLNQVTKQIRDAQVNGGMTADQARALVNERRTLVSKIQNGGQIESGKIKVEQALVNPDASLSQIAGHVAETQSALADSIKQTYPHLENSIQGLTHEVHNQKTLIDNANKMVQQDPEAAANVFSSGTLAQVNPDAHVRLGQALAYNAAKSGDTGQLNRILGEHAAALTNHGQALRAAQTTNLLSPKTIVAYAAKKADQTGRKLTGENITRLEKLADQVAKMPDGPEKIKATLQMKELAENPTIFQKGAKATGQVLASFRALLASADLSGGVRQGGVLFTRFPKIGAEAEAAGIKAAFSQKTYDAEIKRLANLTDSQGVPLNQVFDRMKLSLQAVKGGAEEQYTNAALAEKIPVAGHAIKGSERAYDLTLSYMRAHAAKQLIDAQGGAQAVMERWNTAQFRALGRVLDTISGRGRGGTGITGQIFEKSAPALSNALFSARLWKSRLDLLNPLYYGEVAKNPVALKLAISSGLSFATTVGTVLAAASQIPGVKVETDLRSSDFGKIKIGNTRLDIMGGLQQNLVLAWRELKGQYKSSSTGNVTDLNSNQYGSSNRLTIAGRTVENKLAPVISEVIRQIKGTDISGEKMTKEDRLKSLGGNFVPLAIQDVYSGIKDGAGAKSVPLTATGFIGAGASTYGAPEANWQKSDTKAIQQFKKAVNDNQFTEANQAFNDQYNKWLQQVNDNPRYQKLSIKDQQTVRSSKKQEIQKQIFEKYGFTPEPPKKNESTQGF